MVIVVYDISSTDAVGKKRLRCVSKECKNVGVPVQNSVYECEVNAEQYRVLKKKLANLICPQTDSVRFYRLGNHYETRIESLGKLHQTWDRQSYVI